MPRILHVIDHLGLGGAQGYALEMVAGDADADLPQSETSRLYVLRRDRDDSNAGHPNVIYYDSDSRYSLGALIDLGRYIRDQSIEVVVSHLFRAQVYAGLLKRFFFPRLKFIAIEQGKVFDAGLVELSLLRYSLSQADKIIAVSASTADELAAKASAPPEKIAVINSGINLARLAAAAPAAEAAAAFRRSLGYQAGDTVIGIAGRLERQKGIDLAIKALAGLPEHCKLCIVGEGSLRNDLQQIAAQHGVGERVTFLGYRSDALLCISAFDILAQPSRFDPFPRTVLEAQALGVPVVATAVGGLPEMIRDGESGLLCRPEDKEDLARRLALIAGDAELRRQLAANARRQVENFDSAHFCGRLEELIGNLFETSSNA